MKTPNLDTHEEKFEYLRVVAGKVDDPPEVLYERLEHIDGLEIALARAVQAIWDRNCLPPSDRRDKPSCWEVAQEYTDNHKDETRLMSLALDIARTDTRFWGIEDPEKEAYCSECRKAKPIGEFNECAYMCDTCWEE